MQRRDLTNKKTPFLVVVTLILLGITTFLAALEYNKVFNNTRRSIYEALITVLHLYIPLGARSGGLLFLLSVFGAILELYLLLILLELLYEGKLKEGIREVGFMSKIKRMRNHYIICGGGRVGEIVAQELKKRKKKYLVIEKDPERVIELKSKKINVLEGNSLDREILEKAGIKKAGVLITCLGHDGDNLLQVILAKDMSPEIKVIARVDDISFTKKFQMLGVDEVINPAIIGGKAMAEIAEKLH